MTVAKLMVVTMGIFQQQLFNISRNRQLDSRKQSFHSLNALRHKYDE